MTRLQLLEITDLLHFDIEWKKLIRTKKKRLASMYVCEEQKDILRHDIPKLMGDLRENDIDIERLLKQHLPTDYMQQIETFINPELK